MNNKKNIGASVANYFSDVFARKFGQGEKIQNLLSRDGILVFFVSNEFSTVTVT
jgi:hypothetical protein